MERVRVRVCLPRDRPRDRKAVPLAILPSKEWVRYSLDLLKRLDFVVDLAITGLVNWSDGSFSPNLALSHALMNLSPKAVLCGFSV